MSKFFFSFLVFFILFNFIYCNNNNNNNNNNVNLYKSYMHNWSIIDGQDVDGSDDVRLIFFLKQNNAEKLEELFWRVSNPDDVLYGQYLSNEDITSMVGQDDESLNKFVYFLSNKLGGFNIQVSKSRDAVEGVFKVNLLQDFFSSQFFYFKNENKIIRRISNRLSINQINNLFNMGDNFIELIAGLYDFPPIMKKKSSSSSKKIFSPHQKINNNADIPKIEKLGEISNNDIQIEQVAGFGQNAFSLNFYSNFKPTDSLAAEILISSAVPTETFENEIVVSLLDKCHKTPSGMNSDFKYFCSVTSNQGVVAYVPSYVTLSVLLFNGNYTTPLQSTYPFVASPMVVPETLRELYSIPRDLIVTNKSATQAVAEFEQQYYTQSDLENFWKLTGNVGCEVEVVGPNDQNIPGVEANLDIQWITALAPGSPTTFWSVKANSTEEIDHILTYLYQMGNATNPPLVNSLSYGMTEKNVDKYLGQGYIKRSHAEFQKLTLQGLTFIIASGDTGAYDLGDPPMSAGSSCDKTEPDWPSGSPYVLSIGSTYISPLDQPICYSKVGTSCTMNSLGEVVVGVSQGMRWTTGSGFANSASQPDYQTELAAQLLKKTHLLPPSSQFSSSGRIYPDAVAVGHNLMVSQEGEFIPVDGTSASAPIFAGILTLLNNARFNAGLPAIGYFNPLLYKIHQNHPEAFHDIDVGGTRCGSYGFEPVCCDGGYEAGIGFDATTGLGSVQYDLLEKYVLEYAK